MVVKTFGTNVAEQSSTTGTGTYQLDGNLIGYRRFVDEFVTSDKPYYAVKNAQETKYEYNKGAVFTDATPDTLARGVWLSSNSNAAVSWGTDDLPLIVYIPTSGEIMEAMLSNWYATSRNALISFGSWWKKDGISSGIHQLNFYDGSSDIPIAQVDVTNHYYNGYRTEKKTRVQSAVMRQIGPMVILPFDNTIPQNTEGNAIGDYDLAVTIESATSKIRIRGHINISYDNAASHNTIAVFIDSTAGALAAAFCIQAATGWAAPVELDFEIPNPGVGAHTYKIRGGASPGAGGSITINGLSGVGLFNGTLFSFLEIQERFV